MRIAFDEHSIEADIAPGGVEAIRHAGQESCQHLFFLHSNHAVMRARHADICLIRSSVGQHAGVRGCNVGVRAEYGRDSSIQVPAHRDLLRRCLGVDVHEHNFGFCLIQQAIGCAEWTIVLHHEDTPL